VRVLTKNQAKCQNCQINVFYGEAQALWDVSFTVNQGVTILLVEQIVEACPNKFGSPVRKWPQPSLVTPSEP
jgi:hypothetical protein